MISAVGDGVLIQAIHRDKRLLVSVVVLCAEGGIVVAVHESGGVAMAHAVQRPVGDAVRERDVVVGKLDAEDGRGALDDGSRLLTGEVVVVEEFVQLLSL